MIYKVMPTNRKIKETSDIKKDKSTRFADILINEVNKNRHIELEQIKSALNQFKKSSNHKQNKLLLEKFIIELEKAQRIHD